MSAPPFIWRDGVHVPGTALWCDARRARSLCFISHAGRALPAGRLPHRQVLCTERTFRLLAAQDEAGAIPQGEALLTPIGRPFSLGGLRLELFPSGFLPGAASLLCCLPDGSRLVYAGDLNPAATPGCEPMQVRAAQALLCHAPLAALPGPPLPSWDQALSALRRALDAARDGALAVVAAAPSPALQIAAALFAAGVPLLWHGRLQRHGHAWQELGLLPPGACARAFSLRRAGQAARDGAVVLWPLGVPLLPLLPLRPRVHLCAGAVRAPQAVAGFAAALPPGAALCALPFPDGIDEQGLIGYALASEARDVYLTAGCSEALAQALSARRVRAHALGPPRQLGLFAA